MIIVGRDHPKDDTILLLQCLLEASYPKEHIKAECGTNDCPRCVFDHYKGELEKPYVENPGDKKFFPMLDGVRRIPWALGVAIWETLYNPRYQDQSAERIAERGGFGWEEVQNMAREWERRNL